MRVGVYTLGCKVNLYESEYIMDLFKRHGDTIVPFDEICDVYVINTCTVTNTSDVKSRKIISQAIRRNPDAIVVGMGCFFEANQDYEVEGLDIILGTKEKGQVVSLVEEYLKNRAPIRRLTPSRAEKFEDMEIQSFEGRTRAFVKIQDGCENFCSYCIIPFVRGKCRSKAREQVLREIKTLVEHGYQEVVLTGIHTGNYGVDLGTNFANLLRDIVSIDGLKRLRISSIEMTELTKEVLLVLQESSIIVDHLHVPLQAGSNHVLQLMNRKYNIEEFKEKMKEIRTIRPMISLTTDVIVGFPGETEEDFQETIETIRSIGFSKLHVFPYSSRKGTVASSMIEQVDPEVKKKRAHVLLSLSKELELAYQKQFLGKELLVLVEREKNGYSYGHTSNYLEVKILDSYPSNTFVKGLCTEIDFPYCVIKKGKEQPLESSLEHSSSFVNS